MTPCSPYRVKSAPKKCANPRCERMIEKYQARKYCSKPCTVMGRQQRIKPNRCRCLHREEAHLEGMCVEMTRLGVCDCIAYVQSGTRRTAPPVDAIERIARRHVDDDYNRDDLAGYIHSRWKDDG